MSAFLLVHVRFSRMNRKTTAYNDGVSTGDANGKVINVTMTVSGGGAVFNGIRNVGRLGGILQAGVTTTGHTVVMVNGAGALNAANTGVGALAVWMGVGNFSDDDAEIRKEEQAEKRYDDQLRKDANNKNNKNNKESRENRKSEDSGEQLDSISGAKRKLDRAKLKDRIKSVEKSQQQHNYDVELQRREMNEAGIIPGLGWDNTGGWSDWGWLPTVGVTWEQPCY